MHIWSLAQELIKMGHKVIIISHIYPGPSTTTDSSKKTKRVGVRYLPGPLKVYYCPMFPFVDSDVFPTFSATLPLFRNIIIREGIEILHAHQATSVMALECCMFSSTLNIASVYTDHSLFGFDDIASLHLNTVLTTILATVDACICVSHTCRENLILRAELDPVSVHVIPNAVDADKFTPDVSMRSKVSFDDDDRVKVVVVSRLVYRKGVDLLVGIIPPICRMFPNVDFIIGGDGSKKLALEEMVEREQLQERVEFLGAVPHKGVRDVLVRGHVFLNCSLTESFCIALLEAACSGLFAVSTNVGGVPEVLPPDMINLSEPTVPAMVASLADAIQNKVSSPSTDPIKFHERIRSMYSWRCVAEQTVGIYDKVTIMPRMTFLQRLERYATCGEFCGGAISCLLYITVHFLYLVLEWLCPRQEIDVVPDLAYDLRDGDMHTIGANTKKDERFLNQDRVECAPSANVAHTAN